jgi:hypothetical protein
MLNDLLVALELIDFPDDVIDFVENLGVVPDAFAMLG